MNDWTQITGFTCLSAEHPCIFNLKLGDVYPFKSELKTQGRTLNYPLAQKLCKKIEFLFRREKTWERVKKIAVYFCCSKRSAHHALNLLHFYAKSIIIMKDKEFIYNNGSTSTIKLGFHETQTIFKPS